MRLSRQILTLRCIALALAGLDACAIRHEMNPDGVSYLDIGDAYLRGDFGNAISSYWSPLYSLLLGITLFVFRPSAYWEFSVVRCANFFVFALSIVAFEFFLRRLLVDRQTQDQTTPDTSQVRLPDWLLVIFLYSLFIWTSCYLIGLGLVTPDLCVALVIYLAAGLILHLRTEAPGISAAIAFGAVLGIGYTIKTVMLPVGLVFLVVEAIVLRGRRRGLVKLAVSAAVFALIVGTVVTVVSARYHRLTFGDSAKLSNIWCVNRVRPLSKGIPAGNGILVHQPRQLFSAPALYEFEGPVSGTYPLWYDPGYWSEGLIWRFDLLDQAHALKEGLRNYYSIIFRNLCVFTVGIVLLVIFCFLSWPMSATSRCKVILIAMARQYDLVLPSLTAGSLYAIVYVEGRYLAPFIVMSAAAVLCGIRFPPERATAVRDICVTILIMIASAFAFQTMLSAAALTGHSLVPMKGANSNRSWRIAKELDRCGLRSGDRIGHIGSAFYCYWARLGKMRIVAEIDDETSPFHCADPLLQAQVLEAFRKIGITAVVMESAGCPLQGWKNIPETNAWVWLFPQTTPLGLQSKNDEVIE